jgi:hypothetical protein
MGIKSPLPWRLCKKSAFPSLVGQRPKQSSVIMGNDPQQRSGLLRSARNDVQCKFSHSLRRGSENKVSVAVPVIH